MTPELNQDVDSLLYSLMISQLSYDGFSNISHYISSSVGLPLSQPSNKLALLLTACVAATDVQKKNEFVPSRAPQQIDPQYSLYKNPQYHPQSSQYRTPQYRPPPTSQNWIHPPNISRPNWPPPPTQHKPAISPQNEVMDKLVGYLKSCGGVSEKKLSGSNLHAYLESLLQQFQQQQQQIHQQQVTQQQQQMQQQQQQQQQQFSQQHLAQQHQQQKHLTNQRRAEWLDYLQKQKSKSGAVLVSLINKDKIKSPFSPPSPIPIPDPHPALIPEFKEVHKTDIANQMDLLKSLLSNTTPVQTDQSQSTVGDQSQSTVGDQSQSTVGDQSQSTVEQAQSTMAQSQNSEEQTHITADPSQSIADPSQSTVDSLQNTVAQSQSTVEEPENTVTVNVTSPCDSLDRVPSIVIRRINNEESSGEGVITSTTQCETPGGSAIMESGREGSVDKLTVTEEDSQLNKEEGCDLESDKSSVQAGSNDSDTSLGSAALTVLQQVLSLGIPGDQSTVQRALNHTYKCYLCNKPAENLVTYLSHLQQEHSGQANEEPQPIGPSSVFLNKEEFKCPICSKVFSKRRNLYKHKLTHSDYRPHACTQCSKRFKKKVQLRNHMSTHTDTKPFSCTLCGKTFQIKMYLQRHMKRHARQLGIPEEGIGHDVEQGINLEVAAETTIKIEPMDTEEVKYFSSPTPSSSSLTSLIPPDTRSIFPEQTVSPECNFPSLTQTTNPLNQTMSPGAFSVPEKSGEGKADKPDHQFKNILRGLQGDAKSVLHNLMIQNLRQKLSPTSAASSTTPHTLPPNIMMPAFSTTTPTSTSLMMPAFSTTTPTSTSLAGITVPLQRLDDPEEVVGTEGVFNNWPYVYPCTQCKKKFRSTERRAQHVIFAHRGDPR